MYTPPPGGQLALFSVTPHLATALANEGGTICSPMELYGAVFRLGTGVIETTAEGLTQRTTHKANPIIIGKADDGRVRRRILFEDTFEATLEQFSAYDWAYISGCTYWGKVNSGERQSKLYALIFDIDAVEPRNVLNFFSAARAGIYPYPNFVVESGHGLHLYYVLEEPLDLYPKIKHQVKELKYALTRALWNPYTSNERHVQYQGINQGFRIPGGKTKIEGVRAQAWKFSETPLAITDLNDFVPDESRIDISQLWPKTSMSLEQAKRAYPQWYERVIERGEPSEQGQWIANPALYQWWLKKISAPGVTYGHRYFCMMALAIYAAKCGIYDRERVKADAMRLVPHMTSINPAQPFTEADVTSALECLDSRYVRFPRHDIAKLTGIEIPPNRRNGLNQDLHMRLMRGRLAILNEAHGKALQGRPTGSGTKRTLVCEYAAAHPGASQREIAAALGISKTTVNKWLRAESL
jgi:hypothetical protein